MKILPSSNLRYNNYSCTKNNSPIAKNSEPDINKPSIYPSTSQYLAFCGGKSMNLKETKEALDKSGGNYPPDIENKINESIQNNENKTLIDIHLEKYRDLNNCETLEEAKFFYPEFSDVLSDKEVDYFKGSFMDDVKNGKNDYFDPNQDLALQLLQIYWGEGFSLNDIKNEFAGKNIDSVFRKLNIPKVDRNYGHYLKFSDKKYNERFAKEMSERKKGVELKRKSSTNSKHTKKAPFTDEHKKHISEGLKKFYAENPNAAFEISTRTQKYFEEHPEEKEIFSIVLERAWDYPEADSIKKSLSKHMKKQGVNKDVTSLKYTELQKQSAIMKAFWDKNKWAKDMFSKLMTKSWETQKELLDKGFMEEMLYEYSSIPNGMMKDIIEYGKKEMPDFEKYCKIGICANEKDTNNILENPNFKKASDIITKYHEDNPEKATLLADTLAIAILKSIENLCDSKLKGQNRGVDIKFLVDLLNKATLKDRNVHTEDLQAIYMLTIMAAVLNDDYKFAKQIDENINETYETIANKTNDEKAEIHKKVSERVQKKLGKV